jgi:hypothetical protein
MARREAVRGVKLRLPFSRALFRMASDDEVRDEVQRRQAERLGPRRVNEDPQLVSECDFLVHVEQTQRHDAHIRRLLEAVFPAAEDDES